MKRALVTGATCYLGRTLTRQLAAAGVTVHAVVRATSNRDRLADPLPRANVHVHDGTTESMIALVADAAPDTVFHLAGAYVRDPAPAEVAPLVQANLALGIQLLEAMRRLPRMPGLVAAGSHTEFFDADAPRPLNLYAATKRAFETVLDYYADAENLRAVRLVLFDTYGPEDWRRKLLEAIRDSLRLGTPLALPDEDAVLDLVHIEDAAAAFAQVGALLARDPESVAGRAFAIRHERRRISEIVALFEAAAGRRVVAEWGRYPLPARRIATPWLGPTPPGWTPRVALADGIRAVLDAAAPIR